MNLLPTFTQYLYDLRQRSRLLNWPTGHALRIVVAALSGNPLHLKLFLDAVETFHPGSSVDVLCAESIPVEIFMAEKDEPADLSCVRIVHHEDISSLRSQTYDVSVLLHPWPGIDYRRHHIELKQARRMLSRLKSDRKWILFGDMKLWDGRLKARMERRFLDLIRGWLAGISRSKEDRILHRKVEPYLPAAKRWQGPEPCAHEHSQLVFRRPRYIHFCPTCGMGYTPPGQIPRETSAEMYGPGYAVHYHYTGIREQLRSWRENAAQISRYFETLDFDFLILPPEQRIVLDYGCGNGRFANFWLGRGWRYVGLDTSSACIDYARRAVPEAEFVVGDLGCETLRQSDSFGMIHLSHVLEHINDPVGLLQQLKGFAVAGGWLYLEVPNAFACTWSTQHRGYANREHVWDFTPAMLAAIVEKAGWRVHCQLTDPQPDVRPFQALLARNA